MSINCQSTGHAQDTSNVFDADCNEILQVGDAVYLFDHGFVKRAIATDIIQANVVGIVTHKYSDTRCRYRKLGTKTGEALYPPGSLLVGDYYLSDTVLGGIQKNAPSGNAIITRIGWAINVDQLYISPLMLGVKK